MPPKENPQHFLFYTDKEGVRHELSKFVELESANSGCIERTYIPDEMIIDFKVRPESPLDYDDLLLLLHGVCAEKQLLNNNWRRLHNMPMKRKIR